MVNRSAPLYKQVLTNNSTLIAQINFIKRENVFKITLRTQRISDVIIVKFH